MRIGTERSAMIVLFDGTRDRPWGRIIFADESTQQPNPPIQHPLYGDRTKMIRSVIRQQVGWFTADDIGKAANVDRDLVSNTLSGMVRKGEVMKARKLPMQRQQYQVVR